MASDHKTRPAFLAEKWSGENRTNRTGGAATAVSVKAKQKLGGAPITRDQEG